jgi:hypothetical protein
LDKLNNLLKKYNVIIIDSLVKNFKIKKVTYGIEDCNNDITYLFNSMIKENIIKISIKDNLNNLFNGDPKPLHKKYLTINFEPEYEIILEEENGYLKENLEINLNYLFKNNNFVMTANWNLLTEHKELSNFLFNNIYFTDIFINIKNNFFNEYKKFNKINIIHLRLENDIKFWANINELTFDDFFIKDFLNAFCITCTLYFKD